MANLQTPKTIKSILGRFYSDDVVDSICTTEGANMSTPLNTVEMINERLAPHEYEIVQKTCGAWTIAQTLEAEFGTILQDAILDIICGKPAVA